MSARKDVDGMGMPTDELPIRHADDAHTTPLPAIGPDWPRIEPADGSGPGRGGRPAGSAMGGSGSGRGAGGDVVRGGSAAGVSGGGSVGARAGGSVAGGLADGNGAAGGSAGGRGAAHGSAAGGSADGSAAGGRGAANGSVAGGAAGGSGGEGSGRLAASFPAGLCGVLVAVLVLLALGVVGAQVFSVAHGEPGPGAFAVGAQLAAALSGAVLYRLVSTRTGPIRPAATLALLALTGAVLWYFWWA